MRLNPFGLIGSSLSSLSSVATGVSEYVLGAANGTPPVAVAELGNFAALDLDAMSETQASRFLLQRSSVWNFRRMALMKPRDWEDDEEKALHMASFGEVLAASSHDPASRTRLEKMLKKLGADAEMLGFARDYVHEMARMALDGLPTAKREDRIRFATEFLQLALHSRQEVSVCFFLARRLASLAGLDWSGLVRSHREARTDYEKELIGFIQGEGGCVPFDRYFDHAMFNPTQGTYTGKTADHLIAADTRTATESFFTTASYDPALARSLFSFARRLWNDLGRPERFELVEMGAGMGFLAEAILNQRDMLPNDDAFRRAVRYRIVEKSEALGRIQKERLARFGDRVDVTCRSAIFGPLPRVEAGLFFSNELVDMFPPRKVVRRGGVVQEVYVGYRGGLLQEIDGPVREETAAFLRDRKIDLKPGETFYVQLDMEGWVRNLAASLGRGQIVTIDYGGERETLRRTRHEFGQSMFRGFLAVKDPLNSLKVLSLKTYRDSTTGVGRPKDMTVDVDFTSLQEAAAAAGGFRTEPLITQKEFILRASGEEPTLEGFNQCRVSVLSKTH